MVLNLSQQTDSSDLVGGFKPVEPRDALLPLLDTFQRLVRLTWSKGNNEDFLGRVAKYAQRQKWASLLKAFQTAVQKASPASSALCGKSSPVMLLQHSSGSLCVKCVQYCMHCTAYTRQPVSHTKVYHTAVCDSWNGMCYQA